MKRVVMFFFLGMISLSLFAQDIPTPGNVGDVFTKFEFWISAFAPLVGLTIFVSQLVISLFKAMSGTVKQIISWGTGVVLVVVLNLLDLGLAKDLAWYGVVAYAIAVSLGANRAFDVGLLDSILKMFKLYKRPETIK